MKLNGTGPAEHLSLTPKFNLHVLQKNLPAWVLLAKTASPSISHSAVGNQVSLAAPCLGLQGYRATVCLAAIRLLARTARDSYSIPSRGRLKRGSASIILWPLNLLLRPKLPSQASKSQGSRVDQEEQIEVKIRLQNRWH